MAESTVTHTAPDGQPKPDAKSETTETVRKACERVVGMFRETGMVTWKERLARLEHYAWPKIGQMLVTEVRPPDVRRVLEGMRDAGLGRCSVVKLREDLQIVFECLWYDELVLQNPVKRVTMKSIRGCKEDLRPRVLLTDDEFSRFVNCRDVPEYLIVMAIAARCFGGMRTSDLHAWDWTHVDLAHWQTAKIYRPKTDGKDRWRHAELVELVLPDEVKGPLCIWWCRRGKPRKGPVFPVLEPARIGESRIGLRQGKRSWARELRHYLVVAGCRRRELHHDTRDTRKVDFHSFRRAFVTALAATNTNMQLAMALAGHRDPRTHMKYVKLAQRRPLPIPAGVLPKIKVDWNRGCGAKEVTAPGTADPPGPRRPENGDDDGR